MAAPDVDVGGVELSLSLGEGFVLVEVESSELSASLWLFETLGVA